nr:MAG TPA: major capsid protein [Caudoviricetes sp.]
MGDRIDAQSIMSGADKDKLAETLGGIIDNMQKSMISMQIKNKDYSGDMNAGSVEVSRFTNSKSKDAGTARTTGKGDLLDNKGKVKVFLDKHKEIVEELKASDIKTRGLGNILAKRAKNHRVTMERELENAFWKEAETVGTAITLPASATTIEEKIELVIQSIETVKNEFVDGVERDLIAISVKPTIYGQIRNYVDKIPGSTLGFEVEKVGKYHGVIVFSNHRQSDDIIVSALDSIAQPVNVYPYDIKNIPLSNDLALMLFFDYGTKAVTPDLIKKVTTL